jgi:hypothetical protein
MAGVAEHVARRFSQRCYAGLDTLSLETEFLDTPAGDAGGDNC